MSGLVAAVMAGLLGGTGPSPASASQPAVAGDYVVHGSVAYPSGVPRGGDGVLRCAAQSQGVPGFEAVVSPVHPGSRFELEADAGSWAADFDIAFYASGPTCNGSAAVAGIPWRDFAGDEYGVVPGSAAFAVVTLTEGSLNEAFTYREFTPEAVSMGTAQPRPTVVAIVEPTTTLAPDNGFSPYHLDFTGAQHPWNLDGAAENDLDLTSDPAGYIPGYPGAEPVQVTIPTAPGEDVSQYGAQDTAAWASMELSRGSDVHLYRLPGTKIIGAATFEFPAGSVLSARRGSIYSPENLEAHGTKTSSVAAGNLNGTCPECVLVLLRGNGDAALKWAAAQPWIDVVSNSYGAAAGFPTNHGDLMDKVQSSVEDGQTVVFSSGNGTDGSAIVPGIDIFDDRPGADWTVTVGGVTSAGAQSDGSSRPVDIASYDGGYPAAGGTKADGRGTFAGTSNAAPVVAGTFAEALTLGRSLLGDTTPGHQAGVVAEGAPRPCDGSVAACPLQDGVLTRAELQAVVYGNVFTSPVRLDGNVPAGTINSGGQFPHAIPSEPGYLAQGHGIVHGRISNGRYWAETRQFLDALRGAAPMTAARPPGERHWMVSESLCRQRLWGTWSGGYYHSGDPMPAFDPTTDGPAIALWGPCFALPQDSGALFEPQEIPSLGSAGS